MNGGEGAQNADDLARKSVLELVSPETRDAARERIGRMLQGETGLYPTEDRGSYFEDVESRQDIAPSIQSIAL